MGKSVKSCSDTMRDCAVDVNVITWDSISAIRRIARGPLYRPEEFADLAEAGRALGFDHVEAGPLVRSSYHAKRQVQGLSAGGRVKGE